VPTYLITGATGTVGRLLVGRLAACGASVRAMSRHGGRADFPEGVEGWSADLNDPAAVRGAMGGVRRVFLLSGGPDGPRQDRITAGAAAELGIEHLVKLSVLGVTEGAADPITRWHRDGEDAVRASGVPCSFIRPGAFMSNTLNWAPAIASGTLALPFADLTVAAIDPADIAAVACHLLVNPPASAGGYPVTGPEAITPRQQAAVLADLLARPLRVTDLPPAQAREELVQYGMPPVLADAVIASMGSPRNGYGQTPTPVVEQVTGGPARSFRDWAAAHLAAFTNPAMTW
jgi:(4-alkanoyl-5-oxo-2,5-dihydrofuran-3-yl)methyl phosphate reductase